MRTTIPRKYSQPSKSQASLRFFGLLRSGNGRLAIVSFLVTFILLAGATAGFAYWQATVTVTGTVSAAKLTVAVVNSTASTLTNDSLSSTGSIAVQNTTNTTSTQAASTVVTISASGALAAQATATIWQVADPNTCTNVAAAPTSALVTSWAATTKLSASLPPQATSFWCIRTSIPTRESVAATGGTMSLVASVAATVAVGTFSGSASASADQQTKFIYPALNPDSSHWNWMRTNLGGSAANLCADVYGGGASVDGTGVIAYTCKNVGATNQQFKFTSVGNGGYYTVTPRNAPNVQLDNSNSSVSGSPAVVDTAVSPVAPSRLWQLQLTNGSTFQLVNSASGMCLASTALYYLLMQYPCDGDPAQQFVLSQAFESFACVPTSSGWNYSWTSINNGPYHVQWTGGGGDIATTSGTSSTGIGIPTNSITPSTSGSINFIDANGTVVGTGTITRGASAASTCMANDLT